MVRLRLVLASMCMLAVAACSPMGSPNDGSTSSGALNAEQAALGPTGRTLGGQRVGGVLGWLASTPEQPQRGDVRIDAYLVQLDGRPINDARVTLDTDMTNMSHGKYLVAAEPAGNGHYIGQVHFLMPGPWRIIAVVDRPGNESVNLRFEFNVIAP